MKILTVRFKNLNALVGEWMIDFTHPAYEADGIFAITGPTGSGKTTILDALCLALYGRTPRLGAITQNSNEIMSRHTGECFAEVVFATPAGRYRCYWGQHRARRQAEGNLQPARHELAEADRGTLIASGIQDVQQAIPKLTGLNYERFTRSMLLAQGSFAAFLQAGADERAPLLEQITGTEIYAQISKTVHEKRRDEQMRYEALCGQRDTIMLLDAEQEQLLRQEHQHYAAHNRRCERQIEQGLQALQWLQTLEQIKQDQEQLNAQQEQHLKKIVAFQPEQERLEWAEKAARFEAHYAALQALHEQQEEQEQVLQRYRSALPARERSAEAAHLNYQHVTHQYEQAERRLEELQPVWEEAQRLDEQLKGIDSVLRTLYERKEQLCSRKQNKQKACAHMRVQLSDVEKQLQDIQHYQQRHAADYQLGEQLGRFEQQIEQLSAHNEHIELLHQQMNAVQSKIAGNTRQELETQQRQLEQQLRQQQEQLEQEQRALAALLQQETIYSLRKRLDDAREKLSLRRLVAEFEEQRAMLQKGEPCPLCGALEHPWVSTSLGPVRTYQEEVHALTQQVQQAEKQLERINYLEQDGRQLKDKYDHNKQQLVILQAQIESKRQQLNDISTQLELIQHKAITLQQALAQGLEPFGLTISSLAQGQAVYATLQRRWEQWKDYEQQAQRLREEQHNHQIMLQQYQRELNDLEEELAALQRHINEQEQEAHRLQDRRQHLLGTTPVAEARQQFEAQLKQLSAQREHARERAQQAQQECAVYRQKIAQQAQLQQRLRQQFEAKQREFLQQIRAYGFQGREEYERRSLPVEERQLIQQRAQALMHRKIELQSALQRCTQRLQEERNKALTTQSTLEIEHELEQYRQALKIGNQKYNELEYQLRANEQAKKELAQYQEAVLKQQKELERWSALHDLIGSSDGKRFRNFAQGLSFAQLVYYANQQMQTMSARYLLQQDSTNPLLLNVIDNYQGGSVRSTQNLSGGESFIVSLALALGLSKMASHNVRIDSLFLDEGFGTLDEDALSLALDALANLRHESKLIGLISHVATLKERIGTQIEVVTNQRGHSRLIGPGCQRLD